MVRRLICFIAGLFLSIGMTFAQTTISGTVSSSDTGEPLAGAVVKEVGSDNATVTDIDGHFSLSAAAGARLQVQIVGMKDKTVKATGRGMKIYLDPDDHTLDELMVVAYGVTKKSAYTGSASEVKAAQIDNRQISNLSSALTGAAAGVQTLQTNGQPGEAATVRIRGVSSINGYNAPLYVVDGVPYDGDLSAINPEDIESMNVLKDAVSTSLYGSRGANGVVIITTKKGKLGKAKISVDAKWGAVSRELPNYKVIGNAGTYYEKLYETYYNNYYYNSGYNATRSWTLANNDLSRTGYQIYTVPQGESLIGKNGKLNPNATLGYTDGTYYYKPDDWEDETFDTNLRQEYNVTVSGADERFNYYAGFGYLNDQGIVEGSGFKRLNTRLNVEYRATNWLTLGTKINYTHANSLYPRDQTDDKSNSSVNAFFIANYIAPIYPMYVRDAQGNIMRDASTGKKIYDYGDGSSTNFTRNWMSMANPKGDLIYNFREYNMDIFSGNWFARADLTHGFSVTARLALNTDNTIFHNSSSSLYGQSSSYGGENTQSQSRTSAFTHQYLLNYLQSFGKHNVNATAGFEGYRLKIEDFNITGLNKYRESDYTAGNVIDQKNGTGSVNEYRTAGYFFTGNYNYDNTYFFNVGYRHDGTSAFKPGNRWGDFFNVGLGWDMKKEPWMKNVSWLDQLKLRASFGQTGNDNHLVYPTPSNPYYYTFYAYQDQYSLTGANGVFSDGTLVYKGNPDLKWEKTNAFDFGVDYALLNGRLYGALDFYFRATSNLLDYKNVAMSNGYTQIPINMGTVQNYGLEMEINYDIFKKKDFTWTVGFNGTFQKARIHKLADDYADGQYVSVYRIYKEGDPLYQCYLPHYEGVDSETGLALYTGVKTDESGNPVKDDNGNYIEESTTDYQNAFTYNRKKSGNLLPDFYGGLNTQVNWKGFDFSLQTSFQLGGKIYDEGYQDLMASGGTAFQAGQNWHQDILKAWTPENKYTDVPRLNSGDLYANSASDRWYKSSDYFSIDNITLGYTIPTNIMHRIGLESLRVFASAENLWLFSARQGLDPRLGQVYVSSAWYTARRTISGGIKIVF